MKVEVVYESGQTYHEYIESGPALISHNAKRVIVQFKSNGSGRMSGKFTMTHDDAARLAHALMLACSAGDVNPIQFSVGEKKNAALAV